MERIHVGKWERYLATPIWAFSLPAVLGKISCDSIKGNNCHALFWGPDTDPDHRAAPKHGILLLAMPRMITVSNFRGRALLAQYHFIHHRVTLP
jgi:hypothetical protein